MNLDHALRAAAEPVPARVDAAPAQALLDRIVHAPGPVTATPARSRRAGRRGRRFAVAALAAVAAVAAFTLPQLGSGAAYASWTPDPSPLTAADQREFTDRCAAAVGETWQERAPQAAALGEKRGDYAYMSLVAPGWSSTCFRDRDGDVHSPSIFAAPVSAAELGGRGVELQGWSQLRTPEGYCRLMAGHVGTRVVGVDITVRTGTGERVRTVRATLAGGYFLAWYPEGLEESSSNRTALTLRLADGGTVADLSARDLFDAPLLD